ncbi:MAG: hypothetical protein ACYT04_86195, partial [Nostoc sp.]
ANKNKLGLDIKLSDFKGHQNQAPKTLEAIKNPKCGYLYYAKSADFAKIPGSAIGYWVSHQILNTFTSENWLGNFVDTAVGLFTCNNDRFLKFWYEVQIEKIGFNIQTRENA